MIHFDKHLLTRNLHFHLGFSGGNDSLGAALFLKRGNYNFTLLHIEHFARHESIVISEGVQRLAAKLELNLEVIRVKDSKNYELSNLAYGKADEDTAHIIRKRVFANISGEVVLAHNINDLAETYFQNCLQGKAERTPLLAVNSKIVRPFLRTTKQDFTQLVNTQGFIDDIVPDTMHSQRQILRETVFPAIGTNLVNTTRRLFIDSGLIYRSI